MVIENPQYMVYSERIGSPGEKRPMGVADTADAALAFVKERMLHDLEWLSKGGPLYDVFMYYIVPVERIPNASA